MPDEELPVPDYGYDPAGDADVEYTQVRGVTTPGPSYQIPRNMLPPVGTQGTTENPGAPGSCTAWASTYGVATVAAAAAGNYNPSTPSLQASPAYIYMQVIDISQPPCKGSSLSSYFSRLAQSGTANMQSAPYCPNCQELVNKYHNPVNPPPNDPAFKRGGIQTLATSDSASIKQVLSSNSPLAYGTRLYTDWRSYKGTPVPYVGNGILAKNREGKLMGHCMMIIGYNDSMGAYRIQNSEGAEWGDHGYVWMAYATFEALAQGSAFYYV